jgi:hypothetical protein
MAEEFWELLGSSTYYPAITTLGPEHIKIKLFYQTSAYINKEQSVSNHCLQSQNSAMRYICVAGYFVSSLPFSILNT